jgi:regulator of protease activity HflC (stomatin/prohibitin superfamily)
MNISSKRAEYVALTGLILSIIFFASAWVIGAASGAFAVSALSWQILGGALIWLVLVILFHQRSLVEQEKLDMAQLARTKNADTIFQGTADRAELFAVAQRRLAILEKWFIPIFAVLIAIYETAIGLYLFNKASDVVTKELNLPQLGAVFMVAIAFISFLISRYATGMSAQQQWKPLRAGGGCLLATAILAFASAICLALAQFKITVGITILGWAIPVLLIVLGVETALNVVLDIYRPRIAGQYSRSAFDSRLLGMISEPGGILRTFAGAIDYQFGFKVSQTWFYMLLEKAIVPLVLFSIVTLYALSCIVVVGPGQEALIEHLGSFDNGGRLAGPGIHWKLPWPFDIAYKYSTKQIQQINIGFVEEEDSEEAGRKPLLWGEKHYKEEYDLLVATMAEGSTDEEGAVPVSLVRAAVPVQYRIKDLPAFVYNHGDAEKMLEAICYRQLVRFAASAKIEPEGDESGTDELKLSLLCAGRKAAAQYLANEIQRSADEVQLGVDVVFVGLQGVHPPTDVAKDYEEVVGSVQKKQASILNALAERDKILTSLSGSFSQANQLYTLAHDYQRAKEARDPAQIARLSEKITADFGSARGDIFKTLSEAGSYAFEKATLAKATGQRFQSQVLAYKASPKIYIKEQRLAMLEEALEKIRKYVVVADSDDDQVFIIDLKEKLTPSLYDLDMESLGEK